MKKITVMVVTWVLTTEWVSNYFKEKLQVSGISLMVDDPLQQALPLGRSRGAHGRCSVVVMVHVWDGRVELGRRRDFVVWWGRGWWALGPVEESRLVVALPEQVEVAGVYEFARRCLAVAAQRKTPHNNNNKIIVRIYPSINIRITMMMLLSLTKRQFKLLVDLDWL